MRKILLTILLLPLTYVFLNAQIDPNVKPAPTQAKPIKIGEFQSFVADNNMRVFLIRKVGYPKFRISIDCGVPLIPEETQPEARQVLSNIISLGNSRFSADQIKEKTDFYAASITSSINGTTCAGMKSQIEALLPMMASYLTAPIINDSTVNKSISSSKGRLEKNDGQNSFTRKTSFNAKLQDSLSFYKDISPPKIEETLDGYNNLTTDSILNYFNRYMTPVNSYCIITGDFTKEEINNLFNTYFVGWSGGHRYDSDYDHKRTVEQSFPETTKIFVIDNPDAVQSRIAVRWPLGDAFPYGDNDALLMVLNQIYGAAYMSNLNQNIRLDKGLSYGANNILATNISGGQCASQTLVRNSETAYALENIFFEMLRMRNELVSQETLDMAKNGLIGDHARSMSRLNSPAIIGFGMVKDKYNLPDDYLATYPMKISSITADDIRKASQKYIKPYSAVVYIEGKVEDIKGTLEKFAPVEYYTSEGVRIY